MQEKRLKKGDTVKVIAGKEKGKTGKIMSTIADKQRVVVEKVNLIKRHQEAGCQGQGRHRREGRADTCFQCDVPLQ